MIRVMLIEDHDLIRQVLSAALQSEDDMEVVACCTDGQAAIEHLGSVQPDVVVTDLSMPRVDGIGVITHLRCCRPGVPVVVLTSAPHGQQAEAARAAGAHIVLGKTSDLGALIAAVRAAVAEA